MRAAALSVAALLLAGCGERSEGPPPEPPEAFGTSARPSLALPIVALDIGGMRLVDPATGTTTPLSFGLARDVVQDAVAKSTDLAPEISSMGECPAGPMDFARFGALTLNFVNGMFAGWSLGKGDPALTTIDGIGIGSTRRQVEASRTIEMLDDSTLGAEFVMAPISEEQNLSGVFEGMGPDAKIETLWAGVACNFR